MKSHLKKRLPAKLLGLYHLAHPTALDQWGWHASLRNGFSSDEQGNPIPWMSYAAIALLKSRARPSWDIFEFGGGYSTIWWGQRTRSVTAVEHDPAWCARIAPLLPANCQIIHTQLDEAYPQAAKQSRRRYHLIVVDGRKRVKSALNSIDALTPEGVIVWDDTDRPYYAPGLDHLATLGFKRLDLVGMSPRERGPKQTSILYRPANVLQI